MSNQTMLQEDLYSQAQLIRRHEVTLPSHGWGIIECDREGTDCHRTTWRWGLQRHDLNLNGFRIRPDHKGM